MPNTSITIKNSILKLILTLLVGYKSTNIYPIQIFIKTKMICERDVIFDKNTIQNEKTIFYFNDDIKKLDKIIVYIEISQ